VKARILGSDVRTASARRSETGSNNRWHLYRRLALEPLERRALLSVAGDALGSSLGGPPPTTWEPGQLLVRLREPAAISPAVAQISASGVAAATPAVADNSLNTVLSAYGAESIAPMFPDLIEATQVASASVSSGTTGTSLAIDPDRAKLARWYHVDLPQNADLQAAAAALRASPDVEYAEPNYQWHTADLPSALTDPGYAFQWYLGGINISPAWQFLQSRGLNPGGSHDVIVAVIDTGVDYTHQDLVGNMWTNAGEIAGNGIDDDHDGFVDDVHGVSVVGAPSIHSGNPADSNGHGTHVAGIAAASAYNHLGGVGVAFNCQIMAIAAGQYSGVFDVTDIAEGINYAVAHGAEVINMSFGGYQRSQIIEDALTVALSQAVLVAAAGNDHLSAFDNPMYPAAYPFVLGVMASDPFGNLAKWSNYDYDMSAPGVNIYSTLPGNHYASWSGTSMAAPIVSGMAALVRSVYFDRAQFSSRYLMAAIADAWTTTFGSAKVIDAKTAVTRQPPPDVGMQGSLLFDNPSIAATDDGNGRVNSGETIQLGIGLINRGGAASQVTATLEARASDLGTDPYVTMQTGTVAYGSIGPFSTVDNGYLRDANGVVLGVSHPFVFSVSPNCPNDHVIPFVLTTTYRNGGDPNDIGVYGGATSFEYVVQSGRYVPTIISSDMQLTADNFWIVGGAVLIESGATLTIQPGTQVQWGSISSDPYSPGPQNGNVIVRGRLLVQGTADHPVSLFPSYLVSAKVTDIAVAGSGSADFQYVKVRNPYFVGVHNIDHAYFDWDAFQPRVFATGTISNTIFHQLRGGGLLRAAAFDTVAFDDGQFNPTGVLGGFTAVTNSVFLQDNENDAPLSLAFPATLWKDQAGIASLVRTTTYGGKTYALLVQSASNSAPPSLQTAELVANYFGGHTVSIDNQAEQDFLQSWIGSLNSQLPGAWHQFAMGMTDEGHPGVYTWLDGSPVTYTNWDTASGFPSSHPEGQRQVVQFMQFGGYYFGQWRNYPEDSWANNDSTLAIILELPGAHTAAELSVPIGTGAVLNYVRQHYVSSIRQNAFLSKYWDTYIPHWMRFYGEWENHTPGIYATAINNYWGTTSSRFVDLAIIDYNDPPFDAATVDYQTAPAHGFASTYPFVESVLINGVPAESTPTIGAGTATITITFNRDMNTAIPPFVTFGPSAPYTDYRVQSNGAWLNPRTWQATAPINPVIGNGYQFLRISGAVAADDPWLVSGYDVGRFRFKIVTTSVASMDIQAIGEEGDVHVTWQQNDYDLLAGYNLYRSSSQDGTYTRVNSTIIPFGEESYVDTAVSPAVPMYYKFTVVTTDIKESAFSTVASAAAVDTIPPVITHTPATSSMPSYGLWLKAVVTDNVGVQSVTVYYRAYGSSGPYVGLPMVNTSGNDWTATVPGSAVQPPGIDYYLTATDGHSQVFHGTPAAPHTVLVNATPTITSVSPNQGAAAGGATVTVSGTLFQPGATVFFGAAAATNVEVLNANLITCVTPLHFPAMTDITVINTDSTQATLLNAYRFVDQNIVVSLPAVSADHGAMIEIPVSVSNVGGMLAAELTITFDSNVLAARSVRTGTLTPDWALSANTGNAGTVVLSMASAAAAAGSGMLANITFEVVGAATAQTTLNITRALLNDGAIACNLSPGSFTVNGYFSLAGTVSYYSGTRNVRNTGLSLVGVGVQHTVSDANGLFSFADIPTGAYTLTLTKDNDVTAITAYDAALVLQAAAGLITLSPNQVLAADVNRNGTVSAMDAAYILEEAVGLLSVPFPGSGKIWDFVPSNRTYSLLNSNQTDQDFTAVLLGDVSGNWAPPTAGPSGSTALRIASVEGAAGQQVHVQVVPDGAAIVSADLALTYDAAALSFVGVAPGDAAQGWLCTGNSSQPGTLSVGLAGAEPTAGHGSLVDLTFKVIGTLAQPANIGFTDARLNEGQIDASLAAGAVRDTTPPTVQIAAPAPNRRNTPVDSLTIQFSEPVTGLSLASFSLVREGGANLLTTAQTITMIDGRTWHIDHLAQLNAADGNYRFALTAAGSGVTDAAGNSLSGDTMVSWLMTSGNLIATPGDNSIRIVASQDTSGQADVFVNHPDGSPNYSVNLTDFTHWLVSAEQGNDQLTLDFSRGNPLPVDGLTFDGGTDTSGDTLLIRGTSNSDSIAVNAGQITVKTTVGTLSVTYPTITFLNTEFLGFSAGTMSADLDGAVGLIKAGDGVLTLAGANSYAGGTTIIGGTLIVGSGGALPDGSALTIEGGGQFFNSSRSPAPGLSLATTQLAAFSPMVVNVVLTADDETLATAISANAEVPMPVISVPADRLVAAATRPTSALSPNVLSAEHVNPTIAKTVAPWRIESAATATADLPAWSALAGYMAQLQKTMQSNERVGAVDVIMRMYSDYLNNPGGGRL
jgi:autotransporter-associated beta strand protein